jgi:hypothetical protein
MISLSFQNAIFSSYGQPFYEVSTYAWEILVSILTRDIRYPDKTGTARVTALSDNYNQATYFSDIITFFLKK